MGRESVRRALVCEEGAHAAHRIALPLPLRNGQPPTLRLALLLLLLLGGAGLASAPRGPNPNLKILSFYDTVFEDQKSLLTLAIAYKTTANQFRSVGVPSLAPLDEVADYVYKRRSTADGGSVLLPKWEKAVDVWVGNLRPSLDNGTFAGVFLGDEICCKTSVSCWDMLLNPLAEKFRSLLPPGKIIYVNECGGSIAGRNCSCDPHTSPVCGGCDAGHPGQPPLRQISPALTHISIDMYEGYGPDSAHWNGSAEVARLRPFVQAEIYPRMAPGQLFVTVPGTFACSDLHWAPLARSDAEVALKMEEYFAWAREDHMIAGFNPWHWDDRRHQQATGPCDMALGAVNLTKTRAVLRNISHYIKTHAGGPKTDDDSSACPCAERFCRSLSPQPPPRREVVAFHSSPIYGADGREPEYYDWSKITSVALFTWADYHGLLCKAHQHGARVLDWAHVTEPISKAAANGTMMRNRTMIAEWVRESVSFVASNGLDGVAIDIESTHKDFVSELVDAVCLLKTSLHEAIPGSVVTFTTALGAVEANSSYDFGKLATCLDYISPMMYGYVSGNETPTTLQSHKVFNPGAVCPLPAALAGVAGYGLLGVAPEKIVPILPLFGRWFPCGRGKIGAAGHNYPAGPYVGRRGCTMNGLPQHGLPTPGYGYVEQIIRAGVVNGGPKNYSVVTTGRQYDTESAACFVDVYDSLPPGNTTHDQIWYDGPLSISAKATALLQHGVRGIGLWTADAVASVQNLGWGATGCDGRPGKCVQNRTQTAINSKELWAAFPNSTELRPIKTDEKGSTGRCVNSPRFHNFTAVFSIGTPTPEGPIGPQGDGDPSLCYVPPELTGTVNGSLLFVVEDSSRAGVPVLRRSSTLGNSWGPASFPVPKADRKPNYAFGYPRLLLVRDGNTSYVLLTYGVRHEGGYGCPAASAADNGVHAMSSTDAGVSWSPATRIPIEGPTPTQCLEATDLLQLQRSPARGRLVLMSPAKFPPFEPYGGSLVLWTQDVALPVQRMRLRANGRSNIFNATAVNVPYYPPNPTGANHPPWGFDEAAFTETQNGSLFAIFRTGSLSGDGKDPAAAQNSNDIVVVKEGSKRFYFSYSHDAGETWDVPRPHPDLPTPVCLPTVTTTADGSMLVSGPFSATDRVNLTVSKSTDSGRTFTARQMRPAHEEASYTALICGFPGELDCGLAYGGGCTSSSSTLFMRFSSTLHRL